MGLFVLMRVQVYNLNPHFFHLSFVFTNPQGMGRSGHWVRGDGGGAGERGGRRISRKLRRARPAAGGCRERSLLDGILPFSLRPRSCLLPGASCALILPAGRPLFLGILPRHSGRTPSLPNASLRSHPRFSLGVQALRLRRRSQAVRLPKPLQAVVGGKERAEPYARKRMAMRKKALS